MRKPCFQFSFKKSSKIDICIRGALLIADKFNEKESSELALAAIETRETVTRICELIDGLDLQISFRITKDATFRATERELASDLLNHFNRADSLADKPEKRDFFEACRMVHLVARVLAERLNEKRVRVLKSTEIASKRISVSKPAGRLVILLTRVLPLRHRNRYIEELRGELWELAADDVSKWGQFMYAVRQFTRVWELRVELRKPAQHKARA